MQAFQASHTHTHQASFMKTSALRIVKGQSAAAGGQHVSCTQLTRPRHLFQGLRSREQGRQEWHRGPEPHPSLLILISAEQVCMDTWRYLFSRWGRKASSRSEEDSNALVHYQLRELVPMGAIPAHMTLKAVGSLYKALRADPIWLYAAISDLNQAPRAPQQQVTRHSQPQPAAIPAPVNGDDALKAFVSLVDAPKEAGKPHVQSNSPPGTVSQPRALTEEEALLAFSNLQGFGKA